MSGKEMTMRTTLYISFENLYPQSYQTLNKEQGLVVISSYREAEDRKQS